MIILRVGGAATAEMTCGFRLLTNWAGTLVARFGGKWPDSGGRRWAWRESEGDCIANWLVGGVGEYVLINLVGKARVLFLFIKEQRKELPTVFI